MLKCICIAVALAVSASTSVLAADPIKVRMMVVSQPGTPVAVGASMFQAVVNDRLKGDAALDIVPVGSGALVQMLRSGQIDIAVVPSSILAAADSSNFALFDLPFLFRQLNEVTAVQESYVGDAMLSSLSNGLIGLGYWNAGMSRLFGRPIVRPSDLQSAKLRTTVSPQGVEAARMLGAVPTALPFGEIFSALQTGMIDVFELSPNVVASGSAPLPPTNMMEDGYRPLVGVVVAGEGAWKKLPFRIQSVLAEEARAVEDKITEEARHQEEVAIKSLSEKGFKPIAMEVAFSEAAGKSWRSVPSVQDTGLLDATLSILQDIRAGQPAPQRRGSNSPGVSNSANNLGGTVVLFATDRRDEGGADPLYRFGSARGPLQYGAAHFNVDPSRPVAGGPGYATKLEALELFEEDEFKSRLKGGAMVYVHGYNNTFVGAATNAALLATDMKLQGVPVLFSWPSAGAGASYGTDEDEVRLSRDNFVRFLSALHSKDDTKHFQILAHSMGSRLVVSAMDHMDATGMLSSPILNHLIFAAPDIYTSEFQQEADALRKSASRVTLYASGTDGALACSSLIHRDDRAGFGGESILVLPHIDSIDVTPVERPPGWLSRIRCTGNHSYVTENANVQNDVQVLITYDAPPSRRHRLQQVQKNSLEYWKFRQAAP